MNSTSHHTLKHAKGFYKPFSFPWAFEFYVQQQSQHWTPEEVSLSEDVTDWNQKLSAGEKQLLTQLFRFFTQGDVDVGTAYLDKMIPFFKNEEVRMMLTSFAAMEATHVHAYSLLLDTVGMPEVEYQAFREYDEMAAKHEYLERFSADSDADMLKSLAVYSAFTEGLQLFSTFAILKNFERFNRMKGMCDIVTWSLRDESLHVEGMLTLARAHMAEHPHLVTPLLKAELYQICEDMVTLEDHFIDLCFQGVTLQGLTAEEVKQYIRHIADLRLQGLGLEPAYHIPVNPLPWVNALQGGVEHANFFERRVTEYSKGGLTGSWSEVWEA